MGVQKAIVLKRAEYVARVLNRQLIPAIVRMNYGRTYGIPMPELKFAAPDDGANVQRADYWAKVLMIPGMQVAKEVVYESMRLPIPGDGEAVLSTPDTTGMQQPSMQDPFAFLKKNSESVAAANAEDDEEPEEDRPKKRRSLLNREALASTLSELFSASLLARKEAEVQAAASDNGECRSKDPSHCRVHGTPLKKQEKATKGPKEPIVKKPKFVHIESPSSSFSHQKQVIAQKAKTYGIPGKGYVAPGTKEEFFLSNNAGGEMRWESHVNKSADRESHLTASEHVDELWQVSHPLRKERDRYKIYPYSDIEWVHRRVAYMAIGGKKYEVLITAKEFKGKTPNILYQVRTWAIK